MDRFPKRLLLILAISAAGAYSQALVQSSGQEAKRGATAETTKTDAYEDPLPPSAIARMGTIRLRHGGTITSLAFSRDAKTLLSSGIDSVVRLWDVKTGKLLKEFMGHRGEVDAVAFALADKAVVTVGRDRTIRLWDLASGEEKQRITVDHLPVSSFALSPQDGRTLAVSEPEGAGKVALWDVSAGKRVGHLDTNHHGDVQSLIFSSDAKSLAVQHADSTITVVNVQKRAVVATFGDRQTPQKRERDAFRPSIFFSADDRLVAASSHLAPRMIVVWDVRAKKILHRIEVQRNEHSPFAFMPDGKSLIATTPNGVFALWSLEKGREVRRFGREFNDLCTLAVSLDGRTIAAGGNHGVIRLVHVATGEEFHGDRGHEQRISGIACLPESKGILTSSGDGTIRRWDVATGKQLGIITHHERGATGVTLSRDGKWLISGGLDGKIQIWDLSSLQKIRELTMEKDYPRSLALSPDGTQVMAACRSGHLRSWDKVTGRMSWNRLCNGLSDVTVMSLSPSGKLIATGTGHSVIQLWRASNGEKLSRDFRHPGGTNVVAFSPSDESILASGGYGGVYLWDVSRGKQLPQSIPYHVDALAFSFDGKTLACSHPAEGTICLWETATGRKRHTLRGHLGRVLSLQFAPDGSKLFSAGVTSVLVWNLFPTAREEVEKPAPVKELQAHWEMLQKEDAAKAYESMNFLVARRNYTLSFLQERVWPLSIDSRKIAALIKELESDEFAVRERAFEQLRGIGKLAEPLLRDALKRTASAESRQKLSLLVNECELAIPTGEQLRLLRVIEVLERIRRPRCRDVLQSLTKGVSGDLVVEEAKKSLHRLGLE